MNLSFCVRLFQLSLDKAESCFGCIQRDCFSCLPTKMNVNVLVFLCETVSVVARQGFTWVFWLYSARLFQLSPDKDERECIGLFVWDCFSCRSTRLHVCVCVGRFTGLFQLSVSAVARQGSRECVGLCAKLFQLSLDKAHVSVLVYVQSCFSCRSTRLTWVCCLFQQDCLSCLPTQMSVSVLVFLCKTVSVVAWQGWTWAYWTWVCWSNCARLFQLSFDKDERRCVGLFVQDCFNCRSKRLNVGSWSDWARLF